MASELTKFVVKVAEQPLPDVLNETDQRLAEIINEARELAANFYLWQELEDEEDDEDPTIEESNG